MLLQCGLNDFTTGLKTIEESQQIFEGGEKTHGQEAWPLSYLGANKVRVVVNGFSPLLHQLRGGKVLGGQLCDGLTVSSLHHCHKVLHKRIGTLVLCIFSTGIRERNTNFLWLS